MYANDEQSTHPTCPPYVVLCATGPLDVLLRRVTRLNELSGSTTFLLPATSSLLLITSVGHVANVPRVAQQRRRRGGEELVEE